MEFEWNIFPAFTTLQLWIKVQEFLSNMSVENQKISQDGSSSCRRSTTSHGDLLKTMSKNANKAPIYLVSIFAKRFSPGRRPFSGPGSEKKWYSTHDSKPQGECDKVAELMMIKFGESGHPVFRATSPLSRRTLRSNGGGNYQYT